MRFGFALLMICLISGASVGCGGGGGGDAVPPANPTAAPGGGGGGAAGGAAAKDSPVGEAPAPPAE